MGVQKMKFLTKLPKKNRLGAVVLRDVIFMIIIAGGIMALSSLFVLDLSAEYNNTNMTNEYNADRTSTLGTSLLGNVNTSVETMRTATQSSGNETGGLIGTILDLGVGAVKGASTIILTVFQAPIYLGDALSIITTSLGIPHSISVIIGAIFSMLLYAVIIFVIISAALRGGKV